MAVDPSPTVLRWELARRLRELRLESGHTIEDVASELMCSQAKVSRMETAGRGIQPRDVRDLCRFYGVAAKVRDELLLMARDARRTGWWQDFRALDEQTKTYVGLESACSHITVLEARVVPGLLQTENYTRALMSGIVGSENPDVVDEMAELRQLRAQRIMSGEVQLSAIIDEAALSRTLGHPDVLRAQLLHLLDMAQLTNVTVSLTPLDAPASPGIHASFAHLSFDDRSVSDFIYVESLQGNLLIDRQEDVQRYIDAYETTRRGSLSPADSLAWIEMKARRR